MIQPSSLALNLKGFRFNRSDPTKAITSRLCKFISILFVPPN
jgi:hypothetical protein